jgi:hypothetical protein
MESVVAPENIQESTDFDSLQRVEKVDECKSKTDK